MTSWKIPEWPEPFDPAFEVPILESLAIAVSSANQEITCSPDFSIEGCAFVNFFRGSQLIGRACVAEHASGAPFFSAYFGSDTDEFHGFNADSIVELAKLYFSPLPTD